METHATTSMSHATSFTSTPMDDTTTCNSHIHHANTVHAQVDLNGRSTEGKSALHGSNRTPHTSHTPAHTQLPLMSTSEPHTRGLFPPYPHTRSTSAVSFVLIVNNALPIHARMRGQSACLAHMYCTHTDHFSPSLSAHATPLQTPINQAIHHDDITRIHVTPSRRSQQQHMIYVTCISTDACTRIRHAISQYSTQTPEHAPEHIITGKVTPIPYRVPTSDIMSHIKQHVPDITSLTITRIQHPRPMEHYTDTAYFSIRADQVRHLALIPALPTQHTPMKWMRFKAPVVQMCTKCFQRDHTRSKCSHLDSTDTWCANCAHPGHTVRTCTAQHKCGCCDSTQHNTMACPVVIPETVPRTSNMTHYPPMSPSHSAMSHRSISPTLSDASYGSMQSYMGALSANMFRTMSPQSQHEPRPATRSPTSPRVHNQLSVSIDNSAIQSHDTRGNRAEPITPIMQHYLQRSPTRSPIDRSPTPHVPSLPSPSPRHGTHDNHARTADRLDRVEQQLAAILQLLQRRSPSISPTLTATATSNATTSPLSASASSAADAQSSPQNSTSKRRRTDNPSQQE